MNEIIEMRKNGATYQEIADAVGLSKQWVQQLITKHAPELKGTRGSARRRALDQVNRLQAEIERLQGENERVKSDWASQKTLLEKMYQGHSVFVEHAKVEAIKEFAERLKEKGDRYAWVVGISKDEINHLVKEMTEQSVNYGSSKTEGNG